MDLITAHPFKHHAHTLTHTHTPNTMPENGICVAHGGGSGDDARVAVVVVPGDDGDSDATTTTLSVPTWLDKSFLEHAYGAHLGEPVHIESLAIEAATAKGENYASAMYRIKTTYSTQQDVNILHIS